MAFKHFSSAKTSDKVKKYNVISHTHTHTE